MHIKKAVTNLWRHRYSTKNRTKNRGSIFRTFQKRIKKSGYLCRLQCHNHSSLATAIPPPAAAPFCCHCQPLSSHSCRCQPLLALTTPIDGWLLRPSLLHCPLPSLLFATPIIDTFIAGCCSILFLICTILFLIAPFLLQRRASLPLPLSTLAPHHAPLILWCGHLSSILAGCCIKSGRATASCLPVPLPVVLLLPLVVCPDCLLHCRVHLPLRHHLLSARASASIYLLPPPPATDFFVPSCWGETTNNEEGAHHCYHVSRRRVDKGGGGQRSGHAGEVLTHLCHSIFLADCNLLLSGCRSKKKTALSQPQSWHLKVGTNQFDRGTNNGSKTSHALAYLGNMMLLPKFAKQREFNPCKMQELGCSSSRLP